MQKPRILILMVRHGAAHQRVAVALRKALLEVQPDLKVEVVDALERCARWFRVYYNSYEIPLKYWPALWDRIENIQHESKSTGPSWVYRGGGRPLCEYLQTFDPDIVVATEVGDSELAAIAKRETHAGFYLVGAPVGADLDRASAQPEVNLYLVAQGDVAAQLEASGAPAAKILLCGTRVDPAFASLADRATVRTRLEVKKDMPLLLVLFGGTGFGRPRCIVPALKKVRVPVQGVFITGRNPSLENELQHLCANHPHFPVLGWVDNMHEWMAAADLRPQWSRPSLAACHC